MIYAIFRKKRMDSPGPFTFELPLEESENVLYKIVRAIQLLIPRVKVSFIFQLKLWHRQYIEI